MQASLEKRSGDTIERNRVVRVANFLSLVGLRNGVPVIIDRVLSPSSDEIHKIPVKGLNYPLHFTSSHSDIAMTSEIVKAGTYELPGKDQLIDGYPIVDLGAFIGISSAYFASRYPSSKIYAVEPHPRNLEILQKNSSEYFGQITVLPKAISLDDEPLYLQNGQKNSIGHDATYEFRPTVPESPDAMAASPISPEELYKMVSAGHNYTGIGLLKINIEGYEKDLFSSQRFYPILNDTNVLIVEAHDRKISGASDAVKDATRRCGLVQFDKRGPFYFFIKTHD